MKKGKNSNSEKKEEEKKKAPEIVVLPYMERQERNFSQKSADFMTKYVGSWTFILSLLVLMVIWIAVNVYMIIYKWDPYPFILLNFVLSTLAAIQAPIILMSQRRQGDKDRAMANYDYMTDKRSEKRITQLQKTVNHIQYLLEKRRR